MSKLKVYTESIYAAWKWIEVDLPRITQKLSKHSQRGLIYLVENVSMLRYIMSFIVVVIAFGLFYALLTPLGHGIGQNLKPLSDGISWDTFFKGIYFSVVTISSLGYGHMHPMGFSKALACLEVLFGLAVIGIMIAKVTSQRLSHHVSRLFSSDAQKRLEDIAAKFETFKVDLNVIMPELGTAYQSAPGQTSLPTKNKSELISKFLEVISNLKSESVKLRDYFSSEIEEANYFQSAPVSALAQVGIAVDGVFWILSQLIMSLSTQARVEIFEKHNNRQMISEAIAAQKKVCDLVNQYATDQDTQSAFQRIKETCDGIPTSYFAVPEESHEVQPDQVLQGTDEPQEPLGTDYQQTESS